MSKYFDTKPGSLEEATKAVTIKEDDVQAKARQLMRRDGKDPDRISDGGVFQRYRDMAKRELGIRDQKEQKLDPVNPKAAAKKFDDRKDKDIDNDGDVDDSDKFLHKRRKAIGKSMKETVLDIWQEAAKDKIEMSHEKKKDKKAEQKKTDTGMPMTPVDMSPKMPKMKNEKNKV